MARKLLSGIFAVILIAGFIMVSDQAMAAEEKKPEQFVGILAYRTGPFAAGGSGWSSARGLASRLTTNSAAITKAAEARRSLAITGAPLNGRPPRTIALDPSIAISAPSRPALRDCRSRRR